MDILQILFVAQYVYGFLILCLQTFFYYKTIGFRPKWGVLRLGLVILSFTLVHSAIMIPIYYILGEDFFLYPIFRNTLIPAMYLLYPVFFFAGKLRERIFFALVNFALFIVSPMFVLVIVPHGRTTAEYSMTEDPWQIFVMAMALMLFIYAVLLLVAAHIKTEGRRYLPRKYWIIMLLCFTVVAAVTFASIFLSFRLGEPGTIRLILSVSSVGLFVVLLLSYFVFFFVCRYFSKTAEANFMAIQNDIMERYMLRRQASDERVKILSHDLKHSLTQWRVFAEEKGDENALQIISEYEGELRSSLLVNVENETANAVINQKNWEAAQKGVEFLVDGAFHKDLALSKVDLCSLLGNLLDNAVEAAALAETESLRRVKLSIRRQGNLLILAVENGYSVEPVLEEGVFATSKKDKGLHAFGMRSIRYVAEKYDGVVNNSYENKWFKASVMLHGYEAVLSDKN